MDLAFEDSKCSISLFFNHTRSLACDCFLCLVVPCLLGMRVDAGLCVPLSGTPNMWGFGVGARPHVLILILALLFSNK